MNCSQESTPLLVSNGSYRCYGEIGPDEDIVICKTPHTKEELLT